MSVQVNVRYTDGANETHLLTEEEAREWAKRDKSISSIRAENLPLGQTEWEYTRHSDTIRRTASIPDEDGVAYIGWSNCD